MFGVVISKVLDARFPMYVELVLSNTVTDPVKTHINCFRPALFDGIVDDTGGAGIVDLNRSCGLGPAEFEEGGANGTSILGIVEAGANFSFGCRSHDVTEDVADNVDGSIEGRRGNFWISGWCGTEEKDSAGTGAGFGLGEVRSVAVDVETHVAGAVLDDSVRMGGSIIEEVNGSFGCSLGAVGLGSSKAA